MKGGSDMQLPYSEELNIEYLGRLFDNTSECYKFFWFKAIVAKVTEGKRELTYEELESGTERYIGMPGGFD